MKEGRNFSYFCSLNFSGEEEIPIVFPDGNPQHFTKGTLYVPSGVALEISRVMSDRIELITHEPPTVRTNHSMLWMECVAHVINKEPQAQRGIEICPCLTVIVHGIVYNKNPGLLESFPWFLGIEGEFIRPEVVKYGFESSRFSSSLCPQLTVCLWSSCSIFLCLVFLISKGGSESASMDL